jgi:CO/xanthine dehydrogenase FAD-binding subunit
VTVTSYFRPESVPEALSLLSSHGPDLLVIAGGTIAMPLINEGISLPRMVMGLRRAGLDTFERIGDELQIGAAVPLTRLTLQDDLPLLRDAALRTASWSIRNMGTVGGNLFAPVPAGDVATALLALDARVRITGPTGTRGVALDDFYTGFLTNVLRDDELVTSIVVPIADAPAAFLKFGRKHANTPAVVTVAVSATTTGGTVSAVRIALGAAGPHPVRATRAEAAILGTTLGTTDISAAASTAAEDCEPFTDAIASEWYRRRMVALFVERALIQLCAKSQGKEA